ncbi:MAG: hypothetical protein LKK60_06265 [Bifidobacterium tibiigranuli]|nr:hypothetical protein [Bifidobacterium tibiigranuli]MCI2185830.1 hypothetical protein [Bifidobacterium tibiigranuli]
MANIEVVMEPLAMKSAAVICDAAAQKPEMRKIQHTAILPMTNPAIGKVTAMPIVRAATTMDNCLALPPNEN